MEYEKHGTYQTASFAQCSKVEKLRGSVREESELDSAAVGERKNKRKGGEGAGGRREGGRGREEEGET